MFAFSLFYENYNSHYNSQLNELSCAHLLKTILLIHVINVKKLIPSKVIAENIVGVVYNPQAEISVYPTVNI